MFQLTDKDISSEESEDSSEESEESSSDSEDTSELITSDEDSSSELD